jgi:hypothetical protein
MPLEERDCRLIALAFSADGNTLASVGADGILRLWDVNREAVLAYVAANSDADACLVLKKMQLLEQSVLPPPKRHQRHPEITFSPDLKTMAFGLVDDCVKLLDLRTRKIFGSLAIPKQDATRRTVLGCMAFSRDGTKLAVTAGPECRLPMVSNHLTVCEPWQAIVWELATGKQLCAIQGAMAYSTAFFADGKTLALTNCLYDVSTGQKKQTLFTNNSQDSSVTAWTISDDGRVLAVAERRCTEKPVQVWYSQIVVRTLATGEELARFRPETDSITYLALSEDGSWLVSELTSRICYPQWSECRVCQVANQLNNKTVGGGEAVHIAFSPDCQKFATDQKGRLQLAVFEWIDPEEEAGRQHPELEPTVS